MHLEWYVSVSCIVGACEAWNCGACVDVVVVSVLLSRALMKSEASTLYLFLCFCFLFPNESTLKRGYLDPTPEILIEGWRIMTSLPKISSSKIYT